MKNKITYNQILAGLIVFSTSTAFGQQYRAVKPGSVAIPTRHLIDSDSTALKNSHRTLAAPGNDKFVNATTLTIGTALAGQTCYQAGLDAGETTDCQFVNHGTAPATVWYKFTAGSAGTYYVNLDQTGGNYYNGISVWQTTVLPTGTCHPVQCDDDEEIGFTEQATLTLSSVVSGTVYYIQVGEPYTTDNTDAFTVEVSTTALYTTYGTIRLNTPTTPVSSTYINSCNPTVAQVETDGAPLELTTAEGFPSAAGYGYGGGYASEGYTIQYCYKFTNANVSGSAAIQGYQYLINDPYYCGGFGQEWIDWSVYNSTGTGLISCGGGTVDATNLTITGIACTGTYVVCLMLQEVGCGENVNGFPPPAAIYAYANYPSCSPPACTALPINLASFQAEYEQDKNDVVIYWSTASQTNNKSFTVEKSVDGINWQTLTTITGAGTTSEMMYYNATDESPLPGISYYRIMQTDNDGSTSYSDAATVDIPANYTVAVFPNPTSGNMTLRYITESEDPVSIIIKDVAGHQVSSYTISKVQKGINDYTIASASLASGMYIIQISNPQKTFYQKFVKQ